METVLLREICGRRAALYELSDRSAISTAGSMRSAIAHGLASSLPARASRSTCTSRICEFALLVLRVPHQGDAPTMRRSPPISATPERDRAGQRRASEGVQRCVTSIGAAARRRCCRAEDISMLATSLHTAFDVASDAEFSVEIDPRGLTPDQIVGAGRGRRRRARASAFRTSIRTCRRRSTASSRRR